MMCNNYYAIAISNLDADAIARLQSYVYELQIQQHDVNQSLLRLTAKVEMVLR